MVESTAVSCIHPDKYNNSVDRIISKEEEREDPRRDSSIYLRVQNTVVFPHSYKNYSVSTRNPATPSNSSTRILQEILQLQGSSRVILCRSLQGIFQHLFPCLQAFYTAEESSRLPYKYSRALQHKQASS